VPEEACSRASLGNTILRRLSTPSPPSSSPYAPRFPSHSIHSEQSDRWLTPFQEYNIPFAAPPTESEKQAIRFYRDLRDQIHHGPLYTKAPPRDPNNLPKVFGEDQENALFEIKGKTDIDPFVGVPTYTMKYDRKERVIPQLSGRPFSKCSNVLLTASYEM
jgi:hypothetical protein